MQGRMRGCVAGRQRNILSRPKVRRQRSKPTYGGNGEPPHPDLLMGTTWQVRQEPQQFGELGGNSERYKNEIYTAFILQKRSA